MECSSCGEKFIEQENFEKHLQSEKHKKNLLNAQERQNDSAVDSENIVSSNSKDNGIINCPVCNLSFNSIEDFQNHSATPEHALKVIEKQAENTGTQGSSNYPLNTTKCNVESTTGESILPELNDNKSYMPYYGNCELCSKMFSGPEPYKQHLESQAHKKKVALLQNQACAQGILLKCEPCNKSFSGQVPYAQHMTSETHKRKLQNIQFAEKYFSAMCASSSPADKIDENKLWFCDICNIQCSGMTPYEQHMAGSTHFKNEKRMQSQNNFAKMNGGVTSMMQISNLNDGKNSENVSQVMNGSYQKDNGRDFVFPENFSESVVSSDELGELIKIISPDQKIDFDELDKPKDSENKNLESENEKGDELGKNQKGIVNGFDDGLKKTEELKETEVYETCKLCNLSLYNKASAAEHFESLEHFKKRWGKKM